MFRKRLVKNSEFDQGYFNPTHKDKYKGSWPIIYRSSLELKAYRWMDNNPNITAWGSESVIIPYKIHKEERLRRYFVDLFAHLTRKDGSIQKLLIEIKPYKHTLAPTESIKKSKRTILYEQTQYIVNQAKWNAAQNWCEKNNYKFVILTEKDLK